MLLNISLNTLENLRPRDQFESIVFCLLDYKVEKCFFPVLKPVDNILHSVYQKCVYPLKP